MHRITRRSFVAGAAALPLAAWLPTAQAQADMPVTRYDARSAQGQTMLKTYAQAVALMKNASEGDPTGWVFQWYTHWVPGPNFDPMWKTNEINRIYPSASPARDLANEMWDTCQSHDPNHAENEDFFFPWHRMYLYFFEKIIRSVSGNADFTLPYWDYSAADPAIRGVLPPEFRQPSDPVFKSLYVSNRKPGVNDGTPIQGDSVGDPLSLDALADCLYQPQGADSGFCMDLDSGLHGNVHVLVGNSKNMGFVPYAARDPIFWLHHCNIDRLWASWNAGGRTNPTLSQPFVFADTNGNRITDNVSNFMDTVKLGYVYDRLEPVPDCPIQRDTLITAAQNQKKVAMLKASPVKLGEEAVKVTLEPVAAREGEEPMAFRAQVKAMPAGHRLFLVIKDLRADVQPGVLYDIYLNLPDKPTKEMLKAHHVGVVNFFHAGHGAGHAEHKAAAKKAERFVRFDITKLTKTLHDRNLLEEKPALTIIPAGKPAADAKPVIGAISLVEQ
jgi:tyrosinase